MRHSFNYTGRRKIPRKRISVSVRDDPDGQRLFDAEVGDLSDLAPLEAHVVLIPYVGSSSMRFSYGRVGRIEPPADRSLREIDRGASVLFRLIVVDDRDGSGRILAAADRLTAGDRRSPVDSLLPLRTDDLGQALWRMDLDRGRAPELVVSSRVPGLDVRIVHDAALAGMVFPEGLRQVLLFLAEQDEWETDHGGRWRAFVARLLGETTADELAGLPWETQREEIEDLVQRSVDAFTRHHRFAEKAAAMMGAGADG